MCRVIGHSTLPARLPSRPSVCGVGPLPRDPGSSDLCPWDQSSRDTWDCEDH